MNARALMLPVAGLLLTSTALAQTPPPPAAVPAATPPTPAEATPPAASTPAPGSVPATAPEPPAVVPPPAAEEPLPPPPPPPPPPLTHFMSIGVGYRNMYGVDGVGGDALVGMGGGLGAAASRLGLSFELALHVGSSVSGRLMVYPRGGPVLHYRLGRVVLGAGGHFGLMVMSQLSDNGAATAPYGTVFGMARVEVGEWDGHRVFLGLRAGVEPLFGPGIEGWQFAPMGTVELGMYQ